MWWKEASQAWLLFSISVAQKTKTKKQKYTSRGRSLPITRSVCPFVPSLKCSHGSSVAGNWENTFFILNIAIQVPGKIFFGKLTIFHERVPRPHDEFMLCIGNEYLSRQSPYAMSVSTWWISNVFEHGSWIDLKIGHF